MEYPRTSEEELPTLYQELEEKMRGVKDTLPKFFDVEERGEVSVIHFGKADVTDFVRAMDTNNTAMVPFFMKISGYSDREFHRQHGVKSLLSYDGRKTSFVEDEDIQQFGQVLVKELPDEMYLETALYSFAKLYENDQRRFKRMKYEGEVLDFLRDQGYPATKQENIPGQPDLVIPESQPFDVIGEIRVYHERDELKRYKEFHDEAREARQNFPPAKFIVIANPGERAVEEPQDRERLRGLIDSDDIDSVFFHDELVDLIDQLDEWDVTRQTRLE